MRDLLLVSEEQIERAEESFRDHNQPGRTGKFNYSALTYRQQRARPQLGIHLLKVDTVPEDPESPQPWLAWNMSFPVTQRVNETTTYVVNAIWLEEYIVADAAGEGDNDDD